MNIADADVESLTDAFLEQLHQARRDLDYSPRFEQITYWQGRMAEAAKLPNLTGRRRHEKPWLDGLPRLDAQGIPWPRNLWAGTTITTVSTTPRIDELLKVGDKETIRFLSVEPQLEQIDLRPWLPRLDWIIQGGESGRQPRKFNVAWALAMQEHCRETSTPYFLKQLGAYVFRGEERIRLRHSHGGDWSEWPADAPRLRQMPTMSG